jgi:hypothetical protein
MGTAIGLAVFATMGFALGWWFGMNLSSIGATGALLLLPADRPGI